MKTIHPAAHATRRALAGLGIVAASIMLLPPGAGAERPESTTGVRNEAPAESPAQSSEEAEAERPSDAQAAPSQSPTADPQSEPGGSHQQALCHRTSSAADPYVLITVNFRTADGQVVESHGGHAENHDGPVFDPATMGDGDVWGDIIPAFTTSDGASYEGKNWPDGRAIFENGCEVPAVSDRAASGADPEGRAGEPRPDLAEDDDDGDENDRDAEDPQDGAPVDGTGGTGGPEAAAEARSTAVAATADEEPEGARGPTSDISAVLGSRTTRDVAAGEIVPASGSDQAVLASLARSGTGQVILAMLGLSILAAGYVAADALWARLRRPT